MVESTSPGHHQQQQHDEPDTISVPAPAVDGTTSETSTLSTLIDHDTTEAEAEQHDQQLEGERGDEQHEQPPSTTYTTNELENAPQPETQQPSDHDQKTMTDDLHIPQYAFAPLLIEFLLDQNSSLASLGQQCIVSVASELASKGKHHELYRDLLDTEIFEGVVLGLMAIVDGKPRQGDYDQALDNHEKSSGNIVDGE